MAKKESLSNYLTVLVFKDHLVSRTFKVPFRWIWSASFGFSALVFVSVLTVIWGVQLQRKTAHMDPDKVSGLEDRIEELQHANDRLKQGLSASVDQQTETPSTETPSASAIPQPPSGDSKIQRLFPEGTNTVKVTELPIKIDQFRTTLKEQTLTVDFNLLYVKNDGGNQQGRMVILARGPAALFSHPPEALNGPISGDSLINPSKGEYFSVGRFRASKAVFGPLSPAQKIDTIIILLFDKQGSLITNLFFSVKIHE